MMLRPPDTIESGVQQRQSFKMIYPDGQFFGPEMMSEEVRLVFSEAFVTHIVMMHDVTLPRSAHYCFMKPFQLIKSWHGHSSHLQRVKTGVSQSHFKCGAYWDGPPSMYTMGSACSTTQLGSGKSAFCVETLWFTSREGKSVHLQLSFWHPRSYVIWVQVMLLNCPVVSWFTDLGQREKYLWWFHSRRFLQMFDHVPELVLKKIYIKFASIFFILGQKPWCQTLFF